MRNDLSANKGVCARGVNESGGESDMGKGAEC